MNDHNLKINLSKTKIITFHPHQKATLNLKIYHNGTTLESVKEFRLLGIDIDTNLNWKAHVHRMRSKLSSFSYALREIKKTTNIETAITTYYAYAHAWLSYGIILWGNSTDAASLFTLQKKLIRIIANIDQTDSCRPYFLKYKILTLPSLYILEICKFVRKYKELYTKRKDLPCKYLLRQKNKLVLPTSRLKLNSSSTFSSSIKIYNKLPDMLKNESNDIIFSQKLKQFLTSKCYYTINEYFDQNTYIGYTK